MNKKKINKKFNDGLESTFHMNERLDEALLKANIKTEEEPVLTIKRKTLITLLVSACTAFIVVTGALTGALISNTVKSSYDGTKVFTDLENAQYYFNSNNIPFYKDPKDTLYLSKHYILNIFYNTDNDYYFQLFNKTQSYDNQSMNLTFTSNSKSKAFDLTLDEYNIIQKINDDNFVLTGDYYLLSIDLDNTPYGTYYMNL